MTPPRRAIFIVGLQKSGTTLLSRLLVESGGGRVSKPFRGEGDEFWGNTPPFAPTGFPAGAVYQKRGGERGHAMDARDATPEVIRTMRERFDALESDSAIILNKSPYNTVRLPWLRAVFPDSIIVAMVRSPVANVFSLCKKFHPHEKSGLPPQDGWWGVKPPGWRDLRDHDIIDQCARQWTAVNAMVHEHRTHADLVVSYRELCAFPGLSVQRVLSRAEIETDSIHFNAPSITCFDEEFARGSRLRSKNRYYREMQSLATPALSAEPVEMPPFAEDDLARVESICSDIAARFPELQS